MYWTWEKLLAFKWGDYYTDLSFSCYVDPSPIELIMAADVKAHLRITGRVQGVGYRYFAYNTANQLGLRGCVRNLWNGEVEAVVEGPRNLIERMIQYLRQGPAIAGVDDIDITWADATDKFRNFGIRH